MSFVTTAWNMTSNVTETFLIDAEGIVRVKHTGAMNSQVWREKFQSYFVAGGGAS